MTVTLTSTTKMTTLNGVPARIWEGETENGIKVHAYITRIAHHEDEPPEIAAAFHQELESHEKPSAEIEAIPLRMFI